MSATIVWSGLFELREALRHLPADLTAEADVIVTTSATETQTTVRAVYTGIGTGNLARGVAIRTAKKGRWQAAQRVRSTAHHASIYEQGTKVRRAFRRNGAYMKKPANRGFMPAAHFFVPTAMKIRQQMWPQLKALVERAGFEVIGG